MFNFCYPWTIARQAPLSVLHYLSEFVQIHDSVMLSNHLILCGPLLLLPSVFPSIRVFSNELMLGLRWPKHWSFSFSNSPSNEYSGLIFFRINWFDLPAVQGTFESLLQHHSSQASILRCSAFFMVQLSYPYMTTRNHNFNYTDLCWQSNVFLLNMLSRLVIAFLPKSELSIVFTVKPSAMCWGIWKKCVFMFSKCRPLT